MTKISSFHQYVGKTMNDTATKKFIAKALEKGYKHPAEYAAKMMVLSFITKDAVNCGLYTYQSATNEKIPEDKRGFVAALDFFNGILNVGGQMLSAWIVEQKFIPKWQGKLYTGVLKDPKTDAEIDIKSTAPLAPDVVHQDVEYVIGSKAAEIKEALKKAKDCEITYEDVVKNTKNISDEIINKVGHAGSRGKDLATGFKIVVTALATTALIKRTITPLIATPLASKMKDNFKSKESKKPEDPNDKMLEATYKPWLTKASDNKNDLTQDKFQKSTPKSV